MYFLNLFGGGGGGGGGLCKPFPVCCSDTLENCLFLFLLHNTFLVCLSVVVFVLFSLFFVFCRGFPFVFIFVFVKLSSSAVGVGGKNCIFCCCSSSAELPPVLLSAFCFMQLKKLPSVLFVFLLEKRPLALLLLLQNCVLLVVVFAAKFPRVLSSC